MGLGAVLVALTARLKPKFDLVLMVFRSLVSSAASGFSSPEGIAMDIPGGKLAIALEPESAKL
jgi:hypothetical protein